MTRLLDLLERGQSSEMLTIVFTETKRGADYLDNYLHDRKRVFDFFDLLEAQFETII